MAADNKRPPQRGNIGEKGQRLEDMKSSSGRQKKGQRKTGQRAGK